MTLEKAKLKSVTEKGFNFNVSTEKVALVFFMEVSEKGDTCRSWHFSDGID